MNPMFDFYYNFLLYIADMHFKWKFCGLTNKYFLSVELKKYLDHLIFFLSAGQPLSISRTWEGYIKLVYEYSEPCQLHRTVEYAFVSRKGGKLLCASVMKYWGTILELVPHCWHVMLGSGINFCWFIFFDYVILCCLTKIACNPIAVFYILGIIAKWAL